MALNCQVPNHWKLGLWKVSDCETVCPASMVKMGTVMRPLLAAGRSGARLWIRTLVVFPFISVPDQLCIFYDQRRKGFRKGQLFSRVMSAKLIHVQYVPRDKMIGRLVPIQLVSKTQSETQTNPSGMARGRVRGPWARQWPLNDSPWTTRLSSQTGGQVAPNSHRSSTYSLISSPNFRRVHPLLSF